MSSRYRKSSDIRQRTRRLNSRGHILRHARHDQRLLVRLDRRRDVGEVAVLVLGLSATAQAMDAGYLPSRARPKAANQVSHLSRTRPLLVAHSAPINFQCLPLRSLSYTGRSAVRLSLLFCRRCQFVSLLHRRCQVFQRQTIWVTHFFTTLIVVKIDISEYLVELTINYNLYYKCKID